jgi:AcrR family transcriptional regulator
VLSNTKAKTGDSLRRRVPVQRRSRERVDRMLNAASRLIAERGSEAVTMSDVAERAGVSIGSLYQYFPDKSALIWTLAESFYADGRQCVIDELDRVTDRETFRLALHALLDAYYRMFQDGPAIVDIWSGVQADKTLQAMDTRENREIGQLFAETLMRIGPDADRAAIETDAFLLAHLTSSAVRLAISVDRDEGEALLTSFKTFLDARLHSGA